MENVRLDFQTMIHLLSIKISIKIELSLEKNIKCYFRLT